MESLEELIIGANCFQGVQTRNESRCFCLEENDSLLTIKIGANSFVNYQEFVLKGELMQHGLNQRYGGTCSDRVRRELL